MDNSYERAEQLFNQLDKNGDGRINVEELAAALGKRGHVDQEDRFSVAKELLDSTDRDNSGDITLDEFIKYAIDKEKKLKLIFTNIDTNSDGKLDFSELLKVFQQSFDQKQDFVEIIRRISKDENDDETALEITWEDWRDYLILNPKVNSLPDVVRYWRHATYLDVGEDSIVPDDFTHEEMQTGMWWRHLVAGGVAGAVSRTFTAPLDRIKVFLQVHGKTCSILNLFKGMIKEGGAMSLWRGNGVNVIKIAPESALKFMAYEYGKRFIKGDRNQELLIAERFLAGSLAGAFSQTVIYPLEVIKTRLALRSTGQYKSTFDLIYKMHKVDGIRIFYRGYIPNLLGILPYAGIDLAVYETLKKYHATDTEPGVLKLLTCGTISSACGQIASYPLALVRTRLQASNEKQSMLTLFRAIYRNEGFFGLYRGILPNFMKVAPAVSISYVVYEKVRISLGVHMT